MPMVRASNRTKLLQRQQREKKQDDEQQQQQQQQSLVVKKSRLPPVPQVDKKYFQPDFVRQMHWRLKSRSSEDQPSDMLGRRRKATLADLVLLHQMRLRFEETHFGQQSNQASWRKVSERSEKSMALTEFSSQTVQATAHKTWEPNAKKSNEIKFDTMPRSGTKSLGPDAQIGSDDSIPAESGDLDDNLDLDAELKQMQRFGLLK